MGALSRPLFVTGGGAVTSGGLSAPQTCAAIRAGLSGFERIVRAEPFGAEQLVARIPAHWRLRRTEGDWLVSMAARALGEALGGTAAAAAGTAVLLTPPESFRAHPAYEDVPARTFLARVLAATGQSFHASSRAFDRGAAASVGLIDHAFDLLARQGVGQVLLGGVDSLVNDADLDRLSRAHRLKGEDNAQGLVPGEAAAFVRLALAPGPGADQAAICATGTAEEAQSVLGEAFSQGRALVAALQAATEAGPTREPDIVFIVSDSNGERYRGWEEMIAHPRFYRTRRETLPIAYPAMTVGDVGSAGGALALLVAADALARGHAPGPVAMVETASESGLRSAALVRAVRRT